MANPSISVLMPVWNGCSRGKEEFLTKSIESILLQTFQDWELVIVDDGSTDNTPKVLKRYEDQDFRVRIIRNKTNQKIVRALNRGLQECRAPLVARQDADDYSTITRLEIQKEFLDARPDTALCGTGMYVINEEGKLVMEIRHPCNFDVIKRHLKTSGCPFVHGSVMFRKDIVAELGGYSPDPQFEYAEDYELWVRMVAAGHKAENIPDRSLYFHRNHKTKSSVEHRGQQELATRLVMSKAAEIK